MNSADGVIKPVDFRLFCLLLLGVLLGMFNVWIPWNSVTKQSSDDARVQFSRESQSGKRSNGPHHLASNAQL